MTPNPSDRPRPHPHPRVSAPKRPYAEFGKSTQSVDTHHLLLKIVPAFIIGGICGIWAAVAGLATMGAVGMLAFIPGALVGAVVGHVLVSTVLAVGTKFVLATLNPSGASTPHRTQYSRAESLAVRGQFEEAIAAFEEAGAEFPDDPEPYVRIARLYRDKLARPDDAVRSFKRARAVPSVDAGRDILITQELIEIFTRKLGTPRKAIPELARIVDRFPDHPAAAWAKTELIRFRDQMQSDET